MKRRKVTVWMMMAATALTGLTACQSDDEPQGNVAAQLPIALTASIASEDATTRSYNATNLLNGDTVYVWADMVNGSTQAVTEYFKAWTLIANGSGGLSPQVTGNTKLFPATNVLNFYALVGNFGKETEGERAGEPKVEPEVTELPTTVGLRHTVHDNQSTPTNYYKSDLLYAVKENQEPVSDAVVLPFKHLLSRVQVVIVPGNGMTASSFTEATVKLLDMKRQVTFNADKAADFADASALASMLTIPMDALTGDILMETRAAASDATPANSTVYSDAIVVPQTIAAGADFIKVSYLGRDTYYKAPVGGLTFESGKQYRFRLIADRIGETFEFPTVTVETWGAAPATPTGLWLDNTDGGTALSN